MFPYYDDQSYVFGKDQATRAHLETFVDVRFNVPNNFDGVPLGDSHDPKILMIYIQTVDMLPDEMLGTRVEVIRNAIESTNVQLKAIADWPKEKHATEIIFRSVDDRGIFVDTHGAEIGVLHRSVGR
ncbi:retrotransposon protein [Cucumis melo var. makuwa]|uniref:Retrotransposon protein n=1 Tax=Cucumis melo var. makuwa TaxID=1194695 RepID=A0A5D3DS65_CUCMM|nr:retrotransposon protein [Cucumis melo var. makuwa]TYK26536.1 retrotransposon protein [Cucumis melo var. makuwa]